MITTSEAHDALFAHEPTIERRYVDAAIVELDRRPELLDCYPPSLVASVAISEAVGIPVDSRVGAAFLSVQRQKGQQSEALFLPGYPAWDIAMRRGDPEILYTDAQAVYERDDFRFEHSSGVPILVPSRPRLSRFLSGLAAVAGITSPDGFRHVPCLERDPGPVKAIYACAYYRNGSVKRVLMLRRDFESVVPETDMEAEASEARSWSDRDRLQKLLGLPLKRLAKTLERTREIGMLIYLSRGGEKARYTPRSLDACKTYGIFVHESPAHMRGAPVVAPEIEEAAKDVEEERQAVKKIEREEPLAADEPQAITATCCRSDCRKESKKAKAVMGSVKIPSGCCAPKTCKAYEGGDHYLCSRHGSSLLRDLKAAEESRLKGLSNPIPSVGMNVRPGDGPLAPDEAPAPKPLEVIRRAPHHLLDGCTWPHCRCTHKAPGGPVVCLLENKPDTASGAAADNPPSARDSAAETPQAAPGVVLTPEANQKGSPGQGSSEPAEDSTAEDGAVAQETAVPSSVDIVPAVRPW